MSEANRGTAVLFIHGFMGRPEQFSTIRQALRDNGYDSEALLLPGHGGNARAFHSAGADDWELHVQARIEALRERYERIYLVGHSMGGLLALNASLNQNNRVHGVFLLATPLKLTVFRLKSLLRKLRLFCYAPTHEIKAAYLNGYGVSGVRVWHLPLFVKPLRSLYRLMRKTKEQLPQVSVPVYMIHSRRDETAAYQSRQWLLNGLCNTRVTAETMQHAWHAYYTKEEWATITAQVMAMLGNQE